MFRAESVAWSSTRGRAGRRYPLCPRLRPYFVLFVRVACLGIGFGTSHGAFSFLCVSSVRVVSVFVDVGVEYEVIQDLLPYASRPRTRLWVYKKRSWRFVTFHLVLCPGKDTVVAVARCGDINPPVNKTGACTV